jgi:hypothetical protein
VASARFLQVIELHGFTLRFHKRGKDGSAKCNAFHTGDMEQKILGAVYAMHTDEWAVLNEHEGDGYAERRLNIRVDGAEQEVFTYLATPEVIDDRLKPFSWYRELVIQGATFHGFAQDYVEALKQIAAVPDPDRERHARKLALLARMRGT